MERLGSARFNPELNSAIAIGYIRPDFIPGTSTLETGGLVCQFQHPTKFVLFVNYATK